MRGINAARAVPPAAIAGTVDLIGSRARPAHHAPFTVRFKEQFFVEEGFSPRSTDAIADADKIGVADVEQIGDAPHEVVLVLVELAVRERHSP